MVAPNQKAQDGDGNSVIQMLRLALIRLQGPWQQDVVGETKEETIARLKKKLA